MLGTDGTSDGIPLLGEFQVIRGRFVAKLAEGSGGPAVVLWSIALAFAAGLMASALVVSGFGLGPVVPTVALALIALAAEKQSVRLSPSVEISVSFLPFILAAALLGPLAAMAVGVASILAQFREPYIRWVVWTASRGLICGSAGLAAWVAGAQGADSFSAILIVVVAASVTEVMWDVLLGALTVAIRRSGSLRGQLRTTVPILLAAVPFSHQSWPSWSMLTRQFLH